MAGYILNPHTGEWETVPYAFASPFRTDTESAVTQTEIDEVRAAANRRAAESNVTTGTFLTLPSYMFRTHPTLRLLGYLETCIGQGDDQQDEMIRFEAERFTNDEFLCRKCLQMTPVKLLTPRPSYCTCIVCDLNATDRLLLAWGETLEK